jgi:Tol biopolymer transport system component
MQKFIKQTIPVCAAILVSLVVYQPTAQLQKSERPIDPSKNTKLANVLSYRAFKDPELVVIKGYAGNTLHPFVSRDGNYLFFSSDIAGGNDIHYATRNNDGTFSYKQALVNINTTAIEISPTLDKNNQFYFVRKEKGTSQIYQGAFSLKAGGGILSLLLMDGVLPKSGTGCYDVEVSNDGKELLYTEGEQDAKGQITEARIMVATNNEGKFQPNANETRRLMRTINEQLKDWDLKYGATLSTDELELFFTAARKDGPPVIYQSIRSSARKPFGVPQRIISIEGYAEHPSLSPDGLTLYFHRKDGNVYRIYRTVREKRELPGFQAGAKDNRSLPTPER